MKCQCLFRSDMYSCKLIFIRNVLTSDKFETLSSDFYQHDNVYNLLMSSSGKNDVSRNQSSALLFVKM